MRFLIVFLFLLATVAPVCSTPSDDVALGAAQKHVDKFLEAVKTRDRNVLFDLFKTSENDYQKADELISAFENKELKVETANIVGDTLVMDLKVNDHSMKWVSQKNNSSPTGWRVYAVQKSAAKFQRKIEFTMCYVGIFWCIIEHVIKLADRY